MAADPVVAAPPGPRGAELLKAVLALRRAPHTTFLRLSRRYGDLIYFRLGKRGFYLVTHPHDIARVLQDNHQNYDKRTRTFARIRGLMGDGLITSDGATWRRHRLLVQPAFHQQEIAKLAPIITRLTSEALSTWDGFARERPVDIGPEMTRLTLRIVGAALFGREISADRGSLGADIAYALEYTTRRAERVIDLGYLPTPGRRRFKQAITHLDRVVHELVAERRRHEVATGDLLALLLSARDQSGGQLSATDLRDQVLTLLLAGHETVSTALTWTFHLIALHPDVQERLRAEVAAVIEDRVPEYGDLAALSWTRAVLQESMRLFPPVWLLERRAVAADEIGGYSIPAGATLVLSQFVTHRHPAFWTGPDQFSPERFLAPQSAGRPRYAWFPFGGGPRACVGAGFAMMEAQLVLAMMVQRYRFEPLQGPHVGMRAGITLRSRGPLLVRAIRR